MRLKYLSASSGLNSLSFGRRSGSYRGHRDLLIRVIQTAGYLSISPLA